MATNAKIGKSYVPAISQLTINNLQMSSLDIGKWKKALDSFRSATNPIRKPMYELLDNIKIDGHLDAVMGKRSKGITNKRIMFRQKDGEINEIMRDTVTATPWFYEFNKLCTTAKPWGHALIELIPEAGVITKAKLINRYNVVPERSFLAWNFSNLNVGINYLTELPYANYLIEAGSSTDLGLLIIAAQYVIYKRGGIADWSQFCELFGLPLMIGKYDPFDSDTRKLLNDAFANRGGAASITIPKGSDIEVKDAGSAAGQSGIFKDLIQVCNDEMSKLFLGQTMTTDNGSSKSQADVHKEVEDDIMLSDMIEHEYLLNWTLKPKLANLNYPATDGDFVFPEVDNLPLDKKIAIALQVATQVPIDDEYWYKTFNIPKPANAVPAPAPKKKS